MTTPRPPEQIRRAAELNVQVSLTPAETLGIFAELDRLRARVAELEPIELRARAMCETSADIGDWKTAAHHILTGPDPRRPAAR